MLIKQDRSQRHIDFETNTMMEVCFILL